MIRAGNDEGSSHLVSKTRSHLKVTFMSSFLSLRHLHKLRQPSNNEQSNKKRDKDETTKMKGIISETINKLPTTFEKFNNDSHKRK